MRALHKNILFFALLLAAITLKHSEVKQKTPPTTISSFYGLETSSTKTGWNGPQELERVLQGKFRPLIVIFSAEWGGPCRDLRELVNSMGWRSRKSFNGLILRGLCSSNVLLTRQGSSTIWFLRHS